MPEARAPCTPSARRLAFFLTQSPDSILEIRAALDECRYVLHTLADLFASRAQDADVLTTGEARHGMFLQLTGMAETLTALEQALKALQHPQNAKRQP